MDILSFCELPLNEKIQVLYRDGSFIVSIRYYGYKVNLYLFHGHYMEAFYNHKLDKIEKIEPLNRSHFQGKILCRPNQASRGDLAVIF